MSFTWKPDGSFESGSELKLAGFSVKESTFVTPDKDGRWEKIYTQYLGQVPGLPSAAEAKTKVAAAK